MSAPAQGGPSVPKDTGNGDKEKEKNPARKFLTRVKTIVKKGQKRMSISGSSKPGPSTEVKTSEPVVAESSKKAEEAAPKVEATRVPRMQIFEERAKAFTKHGLEPKPSAWHAEEGDALRVEKPIRMRVHHICHSCNATFGASKECPKCQHPRCKQCTRYPPKRTEAEKAASREKRAALMKERAENPPIVPDWDTTPKQDVLKRPGKPGGQDLVYKKPRQRIRRNCCKCSRLFARKSKECEGCSHKRCTDCARDPAKSDHYPYGYPGDEFGEKSKAFHECHECKTKFPADSADGTVCSNCSHPKCSDCPRLKPQKVDPEPDPEVLKSLELRLAKMKAAAG